MIVRWWRGDRVRWWRGGRAVMARWWLKPVEYIKGVNFTENRGKSRSFTVVVKAALPFLQTSLSSLSSPFHTSSGAPDRIMERNMTAAAFDEYLQQDPALAALTGKLQPGVDGDLLINTVETVNAKEVVAGL